MNQMAVPAVATATIVSTGGHGTRAPDSDRGGTPRCSGGGGSSSSGDLFGVMHLLLVAGHEPRPRGRVPAALHVASELPHAQR